MIAQDITKIRLGQQQISGTQFKTPEEVVRWMGAMQAQDYPGAKWSIGLRLPGITEADVEQTVADRKILRTWPQRGTIHFVVPDEARWRVGLSEQRMVAKARYYHSRAGLDESVFERCKELFAKAMQGDKQLTRPELMALLESAGISTKEQRGYHILWYLAQTGFVCFGPLRGKQVTFALLDDWAPKTKQLSRDEALSKLVLGYYTSHGPATVQDLMWWSGMPAADVRSGLEMVDGKLLHAEIEGKTYWMAPNAKIATNPSPTAYFLSSFDEYLLGYKDRSAALDPVHFPLVLPGSNGMFMSTFLIDGHVAGTWRRTIKKNSVLIEIKPFAPLSKVQKNAVGGEAEKYGKFIGLPVVLNSDW